VTYNHQLTERFSTTKNLVNWGRGKFPRLSILGGKNVRGEYVYGEMSGSPEIGADVRLVKRDRCAFDGPTQAR